MEKLQATVLSHLYALSGDKKHQNAFLNQSAVVSSQRSQMDAEELSWKMDERWIEVIREDETDNKTAHPSTEITRAVFTMFGAVELAHWLSQLEKIINNLPPDNENIYVLYINCIPQHSIFNYIDGLRCFGGFEST